MATNKNTKSTKATASKSKSSTSRPVKKAALKAPSKGKKVAKPTSSLKSKVSVKAVSKTAKKGVSVVKKASPVAKKAKPVAKKPVSKPVAKKQMPAKVAASKPKASPAKQPIAKKPAKVTASHTKPVAAKTIQKTPIKVQAQPAKPLTKKPTASVPVASGKAKAGAFKSTLPTATSAPSKTLKTPIQPVAKPKTVETFKPELKGAPAKPIVAAAKTISKPAGSKSSDLAKPSVSSRPMAEGKPEHPKPKEFQRKSLKQNMAGAMKPFELMSDKKENKPVGATYSEEPHKTRYSDKELEEFDQLIDQKLIVAREQLEFYLKQLEDMAENPDNKIKGLDDGLSTLESERVSSMAARQQKLIQHLENAKIRIKNKVYGICRETGRLISKERLRAVPHATLSIEAKQAQN